MKYISIVLMSLLLVGNANAEQSVLTEGEVLAYFNKNHNDKYSRNTIIVKYGYKKDDQSIYECEIFSGNYKCEKLVWLK